ncbi:hypothetical protein LCGC14_0949930 [marine sediment metagenome]|uniref:Uncharacterized protein n=1 Tax=marine sediment metagenome TaxID=412755 RepID=A0A0F9R107_9ZZZZ
MGTKNELFKINIYFDIEGLITSSSGEDGNSIGKPISWGFEMLKLCSYEPFFHHEEKLPMFITIYITEHFNVNP